MDVITLRNEIENISTDRAKYAVAALMEVVIDKMKESKDAAYALDEILGILEVLESDDFFGTEGANV